MNVTPTAPHPDANPRDDAISQTSYLIEQVRLVNEMLSHTSFLMFALSVVVAVLLRDLGRPVWIWLLVQIGIKSFTIIQQRYFYDPAAVAINPRRAAWRLMLLEPCNAVGWAGLIWVTAGKATVEQQILITMLFAGVVGGGASTYGPLPRVHAAYILAFVVTEVTGIVFVGSRDPKAPINAYLPILTIVYCLGTFMNTRTVAQAYRRFIKLGFTNARLARELEIEVERARQAQGEAEAANLAKSTFLAAASHDLRQPIHALGLFLALMNRWELEGEMRATLDHCHAALGASSEMLDALLDFSRAEAGVIVPQVQPFAVCDLLQMVEIEVGILADAKSIVYRTRDCAAVVESDPMLARMILLNLATNAIRYTHRGGVLIGARRRGNRIVIEVWDTGVGIAPEHWETIFSDFTQLGNPERDRRKGLGLGLAIARRLARLIGSEITVQSIPGRGSVFRFALPLSAQAPQTALPFEPAERTAPSPRRTIRHILLIDDDETIRLGLKALLQAEGYSVDTAEAPEAAFASAATRHPDLLICDFRLRAGRKGTDVAIAIRAQLGRPIPALLITGDTHPERLAEAARADIDLLHKPVRADRLLDTIAALAAKVPG